LDKEAKGWNVSFFPVTEEVRSGDWYVALQKDYGLCKKSYYADLTINRRRLMYLFCLDSGRPRLVVSLEVKDKGSYSLPPKEAKPQK